MIRKKLAPSREDIGTALGKAIRGMRIRRGMTIREVGRASGVDERHVSNYERGERGISVYLLFKVAHGLRVSPSAVVKQAEAYL